MKPIYMISLVILVLSAGVDIASASHKVFLMNGEVMTVDQARVEKDRVWISWSGLTLSIDKKDVLRIESGGKRHVIAPDTPSDPQPQQKKTKMNPPKQSQKAPQQDKPVTASREKRAKSSGAPAKRPAKSKSGQPQNPPPTGRLSKSAEQLMAFLDPDGFGGMKWGDHLTSQEGFRKLEEDSELPEVFEYILRDEPVQLGSDTEDPVVKYAFWKNRLYMVTLWAAGPASYSSMREAMVKRYGPGIQSPDKKQTHYWMDDSADRMIDYLEDKEVGMLWMRSREINHQYKLSQLRIPIHAGQARKIPAGQ